MTAMNALDARHHHFGRRNDLNVGMPAVICLAGRPSRAAVEKTFVQAAALIPRMRQVVRSAPMDLARPQWVDADLFTVNDHITSSAIRSPGAIDLLGRSVASWPWTR